MDQEHAHYSGKIYLLFFMNFLFHDAFSCLFFSVRDFSRSGDHHEALLLSCLRRGTLGIFLMNHPSALDTMTYKGNLTLPKIPESNMALGVLGVFLGLLLEVSAHGPSNVPRTSWRNEEVSLVDFSEPGVFNYSTLLLNEERGALYVGAREAIFHLDINDISVKNNQVLWKVPANDMRLCTLKGKSEETDCRNYIRVLQVLDEEHLYVCGTHAFQPLCDYLSLKDFTLMKKQDDGRGKCSFDPSQSFTTVMVDGELYSGTAYNFLGSEPIISRFSRPQTLLRTQYSTSWLNEPSFVYADVIREGSNSPDGDDDKIYYFFTEVSVEYEFFGKLLIPRIARVCKGDLGGQRTLQKKWTSFLKAKLVCSMPEINFVFNVIHDVFIVKNPDWRETVIYGVFTSQWGNMGLSAVCAYNMTSVDEVFSKGKYMQKATVEQSHTKWVPYNGIAPFPRPGACINNQNRMQNITSSLLLPDKTLQFVKDHPLMADPVLPIGHGPRLTAKAVNYTQIVVERVTALDNKVYDVLFTTTDKGFLHKSVVYEGGSHIIEEIQLLKNQQPIKTLQLASKEGSFLYAGSDSGVVQAPTAFCDKYVTCIDCILARDPYCAWGTHTASCINIFQKQDNGPYRKFIQNLRGDAEECPLARPRSMEKPQQMVVKPGSSAELPCSVRSNLAQVFWKVNGSFLTESVHSLLMADSTLLIYSVTAQRQGHYECWTVEQAAGKNFTRMLQSYNLRMEPPEISSDSSVETVDVPDPDASTSGTTNLSSTTSRRGPPDVSFEWRSNGRRLETPITEFRHALGADAVLVSSWVREEPLIKDAQYQCSAMSHVGNDTSKIDLRLSSRDEATGVSEELNQWRSALAEHEQQFENWKKIWVGVCTQLQHLQIKLLTGWTGLFNPDI
ncbi:semaphorin-4D isoform X3 [Silurus meridionalis]|uniref:semaphorin-4D isoform X3 n=1 Tax=Silurus meridionalis TaxID=175797 RepID=UPI001EEB7604|nr:semaphorin-4D isoform X3 [Silurus meridionalis]